MEASAGTAYVDFKGDFSSLNKQVAAYVGPLTSKFGKLGTAGAAGLGVVTGGAVAASAALYDVGDQFDQAYDIIRVKTGDTGKELGVLKHDFEGVVQHVPVEFKEAGTAIGELNQRIGLTGKPLEKVAEQELELSRLTETELSPNIAATARLFADWSVKTNEQPKALNKLWRASQATGIEIGKLSEYMVQFGSPLRQMGFDFDTAAAMFSKFEKEGVNLQTAMPGLRMALKNFAKDGKEPAQALEATIAEIKNAPTVMEANTKAFEIFGTRAGPDLAAAIREGRFDFASLIKTIDSGRDTILGAAHETDDFSEKWQIFKNKVMVGLEPLATSVFNAVGDEMERVSSILTDPHLSDDEKFSKLFHLISDQAGEAFSAIASEAGEYAPQAAEAFIHGFLETNVWGKVAIASVLLAKFAPVGELQIFGSKAGDLWASSFSKAIGPAVAAAGIGNIATSALNKDWQDAGFEAGGALAGGVAGFFLSGGNPLGAMLGVGLGSLGGELGSDLFDSIFSSGEHLSPLQQRLRAEAEHVADAFRDQRSAARGLAAAHGDLTQAERHQRSTTAQVHQAEQRLADDRRKYGADSNRVKRDELLLAEAKHRNAEATKEVSQAHRLSGASLKLYDHITVVAAASTKTHIHDLREEAQTLFEKWQQDKSNTDLAKRAQQRYGELAKEQRKLSNLYQEAAAKSGPRLQHTIESMDKAQAALGTHFHGLVRQLPQFGQISQHVAEVGGGAWLDYRGTVHKSMTGVDADIKSMSRAASEGMGGVAAEAHRILNGFGVDTANFRVHKAQGKQEGGFIVPGSGDGDRPGFAAPAGSFVLNREATKAFGFDKGGLVPLALEAGERLFTPEAVAKIGQGNLEAMNAAVPRFLQAGGLVEPTMSGPDGALKAIGQGGIHEVFEAAVRSIERNRPKGGAGYSGPAIGPAGTSMYKGILMATWVRQALEYAASRGVDAQPTSGYRSHAENVAQGRTYFSEHEKTQYPGGAVDFGGYVDPAAKAVKDAVVAATRSFKYPLLAPIGFRDDGHASGTGHQLGGLVEAVQRLVEGGWVKTGYTIYTGSGPGAFGDLQQGNGYAELGTATTSGAGTGHGYIAQALGRGGELPKDFPLEVKIPSTGKAATLYKRDRGYGQGTPAYSIDIHQLAWGELGLSMANGKGSAFIRPANGKVAGSDEHSFKEDVPATYHGCRTDSLDFGSGSMPKSLKGVNAELAKRRGEVRRYRAAAAAAAKENKPAIEQALRKNITSLEARITQLEHERAKLRREAAKRKFTKHLGKKLAHLTGWEELIEGKERAYDIQGQFAEQLVDLEPLAPELPASASDAVREAAEKQHVADLTGYIEGQERPAYQHLLDLAADWRNTILLAENAAAGHWVKGQGLGGLEGRWEDQVVSIDDEIDRIGHLRDQHTDKWWNEHPKAKQHLEEQLNKLPLLRFKDRELRKSLGEARDLFYPGSGRVQPPAFPLAGTGSFEEALTNVQGIHWPDQHELLAHLPALRAAGAFGGAIWDVQTSIGELGLKISEANASLEGSSGGSDDDSERVAILEELLRQEREEKAVRKIEERVLGSLPPYAGKAHTGAVVPGLPTDEKTMIVRGQERIRTPEQELALAGAIRDATVVSPGHGGPPVIERLTVHSDGSVTMRYEGEEFEAAVREVNRKEGRREARGAGRRLARSGVFAS